MSFPFPDKIPARLLACASLVFSGFFLEVHGSDLIVSGGGGLLRLDGESGELRQVIASETDFTAVRIGPGGDLFALKTATGTIYRFDRLTFSLSGHFLSSSYLEGAIGFAFEADGHLVTGRNSMLYRFDGTSATPFQTIDMHGSGIRAMAGLMAGPDGRIYASCGQTGRIASVDPDSGVTFALPERFGAPRGIAIDRDQALVVADSALTPAVVRLAGDDRSLGGFFPGDLPGGLELRQPVDLAIDGRGRIAVADLQANRLFLFDKDLRFLDTIGEETAAWQQPRSIAFTHPRPRFATFADWSEAGFSAEELADESISGVHGDPTGDGKVNLLRYGLGAGPREPLDAHLPVRWTETVEGEKFLLVSYIRARAPVDIEVRLEVSGDLFNWEFSPERLEIVEIEDFGDIERITQRDLVPVGQADRHFLRIRVLYTP